MNTKHSNQWEDNTLDIIKKEISDDPRYQVFNEYSLGYRHHLNVDFLIKRDEDYFIAVEVINTLQTRILLRGIQRMKRVACMIPVRYIIITNGEQAVGACTSSDDFSKLEQNHSPEKLGDLIHEYFTEKHDENGNRVLPNFIGELESEESLDKNIIEYVKKIKKIFCNFQEQHMISLDHL